MMTVKGAKNKQIFRKIANITGVFFTIENFTDNGFDI